MRHVGKRPNVTRVSACNNNPPHTHFFSVLTVQTQLNCGCGMLSTAVEQAESSQEEDTPFLLLLSSVVVVISVLLLSPQQQSIK